MKINKEQLIALLNNSTNSEFSLSEVIELMEDIPQAPKEPTMLQKTKVGESFAVPYPTIPYPSEYSKESDKPTKQIYNEDRYHVKELPNHVKDLLDSGFIRDPKYAHVLAQNKSYMTYLTENQTLLLEKRIEWKINKLIGLTSYNVVAKDIYLGTTQEIVNSQSVRDLEALLLERLHIPKQKLSNIKLLDLIYLLDAYGVDPLKVLFFLVRSNNLTPVHFKRINYRPYNPSVLRDVSLDELYPSLLDVRDEIARIIKYSPPIAEHVREHIVKATNNILDLLYLDNIKIYLNINENAVIGNLIDPLAHTYKERKAINKHLNILQRHEINLRTGDFNKFKSIYNTTVRLCSLYNEDFPINFTMEELFENRQPLLDTHRELQYTLITRLEELV